jgi:hypothetical protein
MSTWIRRRNINKLASRDLKYVEPDAGNEPSGYGSQYLRFYKTRRPATIMRLG